MIFIAYLLCFSTALFASPDRTKSPPIRASSHMAPPKVYRHSLSTGLPIWVVQDRRLPLVRIKVLFSNGLLDVSAPQALHVASIAWRKGPQCLSKQKQLSLQAQYGATLMTGVGYSSSWGWVESLKEDIDPSLELMLGGFRNPKRNAIQKALHLYNRQNRETIPTLASVHRLAVNEALYGKNHPFTQHHDAHLQSKTVHAVQREFEKGGVTGVVIAGDIEIDAAIKLANRYFANHPYLPFSRSWPLPKQWSPQKIIKPFDSADRVGISILLPGLRRNDRDFWALRAAMIAFGGSFSSRLVSEIREQRGLSYSIGAHVKSYADFGYIDISCSVSAKDSIETVRAILKEIRRLKLSPLSNEEALSGKRQLLQQLLRRTQTIEGMTDSMSAAMQNGLGVDYLRRRSQVLQQLNPQDISLAASQLDVGSAIIVMTGPLEANQIDLDRLSIEEQSPVLHPKNESDIMLPKEK